MNRATLSWLVGAGFLGALVLAVMLGRSAWNVNGFGEADRKPRRGIPENESVASETKPGQQDLPVYLALPVGSRVSELRNRADPDRLAELERWLDESFDQLARISNATERREFLRELSGLLAGEADREAVAAALFGELMSGEDVATDLDVAMVATGRPGSWSSTRVFALDHVGRFAPFAAGEYSQVIFEETESGDEWAMALRNLAWSDPQKNKRDELLRRSGEMLERDGWLESPSSGFLEGLDALVYADAVELAPRLLELASAAESSDRLRWGAFLTIDRLALNPESTFWSAPQEILDTGGGGPSEWRAGFFARADLSRETHQRAVRNYLLDERIPKEEHEAFVSQFPNHSRAVSMNLLTPVRGDSLEDQEARDRAALRFIEALENSPESERIRPQLLHIQNRLQGFLVEDGSGD